MATYETRRDLADVRSPGVHVQELLDRDTRPVPPSLRDDRFEWQGCEPVDIARYTSKAFHELEVAHLWPRVWQMACFEQDIPEVGDHVVYENAGASLIVIRVAPDRVKAFHNSCLHRGRMLRTEGGTVGQLRCPFHAFTWDLEGNLQQIPCEWDFGHLDPSDMHLPEARVETWEGVVFVNLSADAPSLLEHLEVVPEHFRRWPLGKRDKVAHVARVIDCNWKVGIDAFIEAFHVFASHPQLLQSVGDADTEYAIYGPNTSRFISPSAVKGSHVEGELTEQEIFEEFASYRRFEVMPQVPEGGTARKVLAEMSREEVKALTGLDLSGVTDCEVLDGIEYFIFPNFLPWGGFVSNILYRFRPYQDDPNRCIMEVMFLRARADDAPPAPPRPVRWLAPDEPWTNAEELGRLGAVFEQDVFNMAPVQRGLNAAVHGSIQLGNYQEARIRHYHRRIDDYIAGRA